MKISYKIKNNASVVERLFEVTKKDPLKGKHATTKSKLIKAAKVSSFAIEEVFNYWKSVMNKPATVVLDELRRQNIGAAISDYGIQGCKDAIDGCLLSDFYMGHNKQNVVYNDISLILRNSTKIELFINTFKQSKNNTEW